MTKEKLLAALDKLRKINPLEGKGATSMPLSHTDIRIIDEASWLDGPDLRLEISANGGIVAAELLDRTEVTVAVARLIPADLLAASLTLRCTIKLTEMPTDDKYAIRLRAVDNVRIPFGQSILRKAMALDRANAHRSVVATSVFNAGPAKRTAVVRLDVRRDAVVLEITSGESGHVRDDDGDEPPIAEQPLAPPRSTTAEALETKLHTGFSGPALAALKQLSSSPSAIERYWATAALARWFALSGDPERALANIQAKRVASGSNVNSRESAIIEAACLIKLRRNKDAQRVLRSVMAILGDKDPDICLAYANTLAAGTDDDRRLGWINRPYATFGLAPLKKANNGLPLALDNLTALADRHPDADDGPKVSVIVPAYNAQATIRTALTAILRQTWSNLEVIVVDDHSPDETFDIVRSIAAMDPRVVPLRQDRNQGAYCARNTGLECSTGSLITTHDADDWSHPQKIEAQVRTMLSRSGTLACMTNWARVHPDLTFDPEWQLSFDGYVAYNPSSLLFARETIQALGGWDAVRVEADGELLERVEADFGIGSIIAHQNRVPFSFGLTAEASLTRHTLTHLRTLKFGVRRDYREAARWWHQKAAGPARLRIDAHSVARPFPAPAPLLPNRPPRPTYDLLCTTDFNLPPPLLAPTMTIVRASLASGRRIAVFHWPRFHAPAAPLNPAIWEMAARSELDVISAGEAIEAAIVLVAYPAVARFLVDLAPAVTIKRLVAIADAPNAQGDRYDRTTVDGNLFRAFGAVPEWLSNSACFGQLNLRADT